MAIAIGITGHLNLTEETQALVADDIRELLRRHPSSELVGISCLARGADTIFAEIVVDLGGKLGVILPARTYRERKVKDESRPDFDRLVQAAHEILVMPYEEPGRDAYEAANTALLQRVDQLLAVWDGLASADQGGTAAVVRQARAMSKPVHVVWPHGSART